MQEAFDYFVAGAGTVHAPGGASDANLHRLMHDYSFSKQCWQNVPVLPYDASTEADREALCNSKLQQFFSPAGGADEWWDQTTNTYTPSGTIQVSGDGIGRFRFCSYGISYTYADSNGILIDVMGCLNGANVHVDENVPNMLAPRGRDKDNPSDQTIYTATFTAPPAVNDATIFCDAAGTDDGAVTLTLPTSVSG